MELDKLGYIYIGNTIAVCQHKRLVADIVLYTLYTSAGHCVKTCVHYGNLPVFRAVAVNNHLIFTACEVKCNIGCMQEVVCKIFLYNVLFVACADNELIEAVRRIELHYVPYYRHTAKLNHRLWLELAFFADSCAETSG